MKPLQIIELNNKTTVDMRKKCTHVHIKDMTITIYTKQYEDLLLLIPTGSLLQPHGGQDAVHQGLVLKHDPAEPMEERHGFSSPLE